MLTAWGIAVLPLLGTQVARADEHTADAERETVVVGHPTGPATGRVGSHFVGLSVEWSLIERYMGPGARPGFARLLANLDSGILRIGGSSQDLMEFDPAAPNTNRVITPEDLAAIRSTLDLTRPGGHTGWDTVLGTAMAPVTDSRPFVSPEHTRRFIEQGVTPAFAGAEDQVAGIELGNEPDLTYRYDLDAYLADFVRWRDAGAGAPFPTITPATSEQIATWQDMRDDALNTRFFHDWPTILDKTAPTMREHPGPLGVWAADHFYPLARTCASDPYRCPTIPALLDPVRSDSLAYNTYVHAGVAAEHGVGYRLEEINTAAGRGADGVSNVAASAIWALQTMFDVACPNPPQDPGTNDDCGVGGVGVNFHNAEVRAFWEPQEGNAYYNAIDYDASDVPAEEVGAPTAKPEYYAMLLFSAFAQDTRKLQRLPITASDSVRAWRVRGPGSERRDFLVNRSDHPVTVDLPGSGSTYLLDRMAPHDPEGAGRTLDAPQVTIDGRQVAANGTWPGFDPESGSVDHGRISVDLGVGEAVVVRTRLH